jgi:hypothetical protein
MEKKIKKSQRRKAISPKKKNSIDTNFRFIVPMPGKSPWPVLPTQLLYKKIHTFSDNAGDYALEDYQAQFLMQREYLID